MKLGGELLGGEGGGVFFDVFERLTLGLGEAGVEKLYQVASTVGRGVPRTPGSVHDARGGVPAYATS